MIRPEALDVSLEGQTWESLSKARRSQQDAGAPSQRGFATTETGDADSAWPAEGCVSWTSASRRGSVGWGSVIASWLEDTGESVVPNQADKPGARTMVAVPWAVKQLGKLRTSQPDLIDRAVARLLEENEELRWAVVLSAYLDREINLGKAAELLGMHELELRDRFVELGVPVRWGSENLAEARAEVAALDCWLGGQPTPSEQ